MLLEYYEETLKDIEELEINLEDKSIKEIRNTLESIVNRGWLQIESMFGATEVNIKQKKYTKEEIQEHFNQMLNVVPFTKINKNKNDST